MCGVIQFRQVCNNCWLVHTRRTTIDWCAQAIAQNRIGGDQGCVLFQARFDVAWVLCVSCVANLSIEMPDNFNPGLPSHPPSLPDNSNTGLPTHPPSSPSSVASSRTHLFSTPSDTPCSPSNLDSSPSNPASSPTQPDSYPYLESLPPQEDAAGSWQ